MLTDISERLLKPLGVFGRMQSRNPVLQFPLTQEVGCGVGLAGLACAARQRATRETTAQDSSKGGARETGCRDLYDVVH